MGLLGASPGLTAALPVNTSAWSWGIALRLNSGLASVHVGLAVTVPVGFWP